MGPMGVGKSGPPDRKKSRSREHTAVKQGDFWQHSSLGSPEGPRADA